MGENPRWWQWNQYEWSKLIDISKRAMGLLVFKDPLACGIPKYTAMVTDCSWNDWSTYSDRHGVLSIGYQMNPDWQAFCGSVWLFWKPQYANPTYKLILVVKENELVIVSSLRQLNRFASKFSAVILVKREIGTSQNCQHRAIFQLQIVMLDMSVARLVMSI